MGPLPGFTSNPQNAMSVHGLLWLIHSFGLGVYSNGLSTAVNFVSGVSQLRLHPSTYVVKLWDAICYR